MRSANTLKRMSAFYIVYHISMTSARLFDKIENVYMLLWNAKAKTFLYLYKTAECDFDTSAVLRS